MASLNIPQTGHATNKSLSQTEAAWKETDPVHEPVWESGGLHATLREVGRPGEPASRRSFSFHSSRLPEGQRVRCWERQRSSPRWPACSHPLRFGYCPCGRSCSPGPCDGASPPVASSSPVAAAPASVCWWPEREGRVSCPRSRLRCHQAKGTHGDTRGQSQEVMGCFSARTEKTHLIDQKWCLSHHSSNLHLNFYLFAELAKEINSILLKIQYTMT